jgi:hypothetical protein
MKHYQLQKQGPHQDSRDDDFVATGILDSSPRGHELGMLVALYLKDKFHSDLQNARRIISADTAEDTCWIDGRGDRTKV